MIDHVIKMLFIVKKSNKRIESESNKYLNSKKKKNEKKIVDFIRSYMLKKIME